MSHLPNRKAFPTPLPKDLREAALAAHRSGERAVDIADRLNQKAVTVRAWISRERKKDSLLPPVLNSSVEVKQASEPVDIPDTLDACQQQYERDITRYALTVARHAAGLEGEAAVRQSDKLLKADQISRKALRIQEPVTPNSVIQIGLLIGAKHHQETLTIEQN